MPSPIKAGGATTQPRHVPVAQPSVAQQPRADGAKRGPAKRQASRPAVKPGVGTDLTPVRRRVAVERPVAAPVVAVSPGEPGISVAAAILLGLLVLCGIGAVGAVAERLRVRSAKRAASSLTFVETMDAAIEAELQAMISETGAHAVRAPDGIEDVGDDCELSATR